MSMLIQNARAPGVAQAITLAQGDIHLWLTYYDEINDAELLASYFNLLTDAEKSQQQRFYFERDRKRYLVTRALVRTVLSRYAAVHPKDWIFTNNEYGRPEISTDLPPESRLSFNLSHTRGLIALGVTRNGALGVDVENIVEREVSLDIAHRFFAREEAETLGRLPVDRQRYRFFEYWTFKESYIKARGMGLSIPLDKFSFALRSDRDVELAIDEELNDAPSRWRFWQFQPRSAFLLAVCAERLASVAPKLLITEATPLSSKQDIEPRTLRASN